MSETILTFLPPSTNFAKRVSLTYSGCLFGSLDAISRTDRLIASTQTRSSSKFVGDDTWLFANGRFLASKGQLFQFPVKYPVISPTNTRTFLDCSVGCIARRIKELVVRLRKYLSTKCVKSSSRLIFRDERRNVFRKRIGKNIFFASLLYIARGINRKCTDLRAEGALSRLS